ncbi:MAG: desulfoferrodoxin [Clostridiales bacterium]|nr:desulfoferrodoxin [Clostridiales bacterium]
MKFYKCDTCGKIIVIVNETAVPTMCCGKAMRELVPGEVDAAQEKHVPVVVVEGNLLKVSVGSVAHPMLDEHYITFIAVETDKGYQIKNLKPGETPAATFALTEGETPIAAYEYCNLHGLWKKQI